MILNVNLSSIIAIIVLIFSLLSISFYRLSRVQSLLITFDIMTKTFDHNKTLRLFQNCNPYNCFENVYKGLNKLLEYLQSNSI